MAALEVWEAARPCASCSNAILHCLCSTCTCCSRVLSDPSQRRHCKRCWRSACPACVTRWRYVRLMDTPEAVCDGCAVPRAIAFLRDRSEGRPLWGLYALWGATDTPAMCITAACGTYSYASACRACGLPTVSTQPHETRSVRDKRSPASTKRDDMMFLEAGEYFGREAAVGGYSDTDVEKTFRSCFPEGEETFAFPSVGGSGQARRLLMSLVAAGVAYEYDRAPSVTLSLSDFPFARLLRLVEHNSRYSVLDAPGKARFVSFPGMHDSRTVGVSLRFTRVTRRQWIGNMENQLADGTGLPATDLGGLDYRVHSGFFREAEKVIPKIEKFVRDALDNGYQLVFSGHSLGGAVATLVALRLLQTYPSLARNTVTCFTFGAPLVGDHQLTDLVQMFGFTSNFHHVVHISDIVPRLLCADEWLLDSAYKVVKGAISLWGKVKGWMVRSVRGGDGVESRDRDPESAEYPEGAFEEAEGNSGEARGSGAGRGGYACFGHYHFLNPVSGNFFSTEDPDVAFQTLKSIAESGMKVKDHSITAYNRAVFLRVYTNGQIH